MGASPEDLSEKRQLSFGQLKKGMKRYCVAGDKNREKAIPMTRASSILPALSTVSESADRKGNSQGMDAVGKEDVKDSYKLLTLDGTRRLCESFHILQLMEDPLTQVSTRPTTTDPSLPSQSHRQHHIEVLFSQNQRIFVSKIASHPLQAGQIKAEP